MSQARWDAVDAYFTATFRLNDEALEAALEASEAAGLPPIAVAPNQGKLLQLLAQSLGARCILEVGTLGGYSTIWLARALPPGGRLISLELNPRHAEVARGNLANAGLADRTEVRTGPALTSLDALVADGDTTFDFVFLDADKEGYPAYFERALRLARPGALIVADNAVREGRVIEADSDNAAVQGVRRMIELIANDRRVEATGLQTVGVKGYDGFVIARVVA